MVFYEDKIKMFYENNRLELNLVYKNFENFNENISQELGEDYTYTDILMTNIKIAQDLHTKNDECLLYKYQEKFADCDNMKDLRQYEKLISQLTSVINKKKRFIRQFYLQLK